MGGVGARDRGDNSSREDTCSLAHELSGGVLAREEFVEVLEVVLGQDLFEHGHAFAYIQHPVQPRLLPRSRQPAPAASAQVVRDIARGWPQGQKGQLPWNHQDRLTPPDSSHEHYLQPHIPFSLLSPPYPSLKLSSLTSPLQGFCCRGTHLG